MHSPDLACRVADAGEYIRFGSSLPKSTTELATLAATRGLDADYPWAVHQMGARNAGVSERAIATLREGSSTDGLPDDEKLVIDYVRMIQSDHRIPTELFAALRERFGLQGVVDLGATVGLYGLLACIVNTFELKPIEV
jgi:4-carboxymuconolactone decarboxylase